MVTENKIDLVQIQAISWLSKLAFSNTKKEVQSVRLYCQHRDTDAGPVTFDQLATLSCCLGEEPFSFT